MKRKILVRCMIVLVVISITVCFFGCTEKKQDVSYGTVYLTIQPVVLPKNDTPDGYVDPLIITSSHIMTQNKEIIEIRDYSEIKNETIYTSNEPIEVYQGVITTKWFYYYSVLSTETGWGVADETFYQRIREDSYCMEKLNMDWFSYVVEEDTPFYGMEWREVCKTCRSISEITDEPDFWGTDVDGNDVVWDLSLQKKNPDVWNICNDYYGSLNMAALQRYGIFSFDGYRGMGKLEVTIPYQKEMQDDRTITDEKKIILDVVGYIETEADKLLSTGVSMDKNSEEYKIVMQQLQNPVIYSVCGNFLEEVK